MPADVVVRAVARDADGAGELVRVEEDKGGVLFWPGGPTYT